MTKRERIIASLPPESEYEGEGLIVRRLYVSGKTVAAIGAARGYSTTKAYRLLNPEYAERDRSASRDYKAQNHDAMLAYGRAYGESNRKPCTGCGGSMGQLSALRGGGVCRKCVAQERKRRDDEVVQLWHEGVSETGIAARTGTTRNAVSVRSHRLRREGRIGYRRAGWTKARVAA